MSAIVIPALLLAVILPLTVWAYRKAKAREAANAAMDARIRPQVAEIMAEARRLAQLDKAMTDERGVCWVCTTPVRVLELVDTGARVDLACVECAEVLKARKGATA